VLQLEDLMNQNQFQYSQPDMSFEDFYNQYYGNYGGDGGGDEGNNGVTEITAPTSTARTFTPDPQFEGNVPVPGMPGWSVYNGINTMAIVNWVNPKTGERFTAPHGGFSPPSGEGWVTEELKSKPLDPNYKRPDATIMGNTGTTATQPYAILPAAQQTTAAYAQMAKNNAATAAAASANNDRGSDRIVAAAPAPAASNVQTRYQTNLEDGLESRKVPALAPAPAAAAPTMSDQFIQRYERAEATGNDNPKVKVVEPVKTVVKKSVTPVKVWGNRNN